MVLGWGRLAVSTMYDAYGAYAPYDAILGNTLVKFGVVALLVYKHEKVVHYSVLTWYDRCGFLHLMIVMESQLCV